MRYFVTVNPSHIAYGFWMHYKYSLLSYLLTSAVSSLMMLWSYIYYALVAYERLYGSALRHFCNAVVWIAELVHVKKSWKLVEISLTTLF